MSVYFITCREANAVKIGHSVDPYGRLPEIQLGCPLPCVLEAILPGGAPRENELHKYFSSDRIRGEWFTITEMIEIMIQANPAPPARPTYLKPNPHKRLSKPRRRHWSVEEKYEQAMADMRVDDERALLAKIDEQVAA